MSDRAQGIELVADALRRAGLGVYRATSGQGSDLIAANAADTVFIPVKIVSQDEPGLNFQRGQVERLERCGGIAAFVCNGELWYLPVAVFRNRAADPPNRTDDRLYITISKNREWLEAYAGESGIRIAFAKLLG